MKILKIIVAILMIAVIALSVVGIIFFEEVVEEAEPTDFFDGNEGSYILEYDILADGILASMIVAMVGQYCEPEITVIFTEDSCTLQYAMSNKLGGLYLVVDDELIEWTAGEDDGTNITYSLVLDKEVASGDMYLQSSVPAIKMTINYGVKLIEPTVEDAVGEAVEL
ncbi:MAG: hypothetical protein R3Y23_04435 [Bacillota bacterium]